MAQAKRRKADKKPFFSRKEKSTEIKVKKEKKPRPIIGGGFSTLFIGMLIGSVFTAIYMGYLQDPMKGLGSGINNLIVTTKNTNDNQQNDQVEQASSPAAENIDVKFDYYTVLPEIERLLPEVPKEVEAIAKPAAKKPEQNKPASIDDAATATEGTQGTTPEATPDTSLNAALKKSSYYILQVASYANNDDAEQLKAKLALSGRQAYIQKVTIDGKNFFRVRMGPFNNVSTMESARKSFIDKGLQPLLFEVEKTE